MPHGPDQAVMVPTVAASHGAWSAGAGVTVICSGCPDSSRSVSSSGPFAPIFFGVWQSWQPPKDTRYSPRLTCAVGVVPGAARAREDIESAASLSLIHI